MYTNDTYSVGTALSPEGLYRNYRQYNAAKERGLLPQHVYLLMWMNFSALKMSLFSRQVPSQDVNELVVGDSSRDVKRFLEEQLEMLWKSMQNQFSLLNEELEYLIATMMRRFVQVSLSPEI